MQEISKPYMKKLSQEERKKILYEAYYASQRGDGDEYDRLCCLLPVHPLLANDLKRSIGIEAVIASGMNLVEAVEAYGEDWLRA